MDLTTVFRAGAIGYWLGGPDSGDGRVLSLATATLHPAWPWRWFTPNFHSQNLDMSNQTQIKSWCGTLRRRPQSWLSLLAALFADLSRSLVVHIVKAVSHLRSEADEVWKSIHGDNRKDKC